MKARIVVKTILITSIVFFSLVALLCIAVDSSEIVVKRLDGCTGQPFDRIGNNVAPSDKTFLVAGIEVTNNGYDSFNVDPSFFGIHRNGDLYKSYYATYSLSDMNITPLDSVMLKSGDSVKGYIVFEIPRGNNENDIEYIGSRDIDIRYECA